jgi:hypothetical protein
VTIGFVLLALVAALADVIATRRGSGYRGPGHRGRGHRGPGDLDRGEIARAG